ncbi:MAG: M24 family metallopeptidase [Candidatus Methanodesulfokora washburnensis]|jgi:Xaa-Pro aminopeptidase
MFPKEEYDSRISKLKKWMDSKRVDLCVIRSGANMFYLSGTNTASALIVPIDEEPFLIARYAFGDKIAEEQAVYEVVAVKPFYGLDRVEDKKISLLIKEEIKKRGIRARKLAFDGNKKEEEELRRTFRRGGRSLPVLNLSQEILRIRAVKSEREIETMRRSADISVNAFYNVIPEIVPGATEKEIAGRIELEMRRLGGDGPAFPTIVCFGENSFNAHHIPTERRLKSGDIVLIDFGSSYHMYASDITRTFTVGKPERKLEEMWYSVYESQEKAIMKIKAGINAEDPDKEARDVLNKSGLLENFVHSTGHGIGLEVHEPPRLLVGVKERIESGYAVTVEPGVYIKGWGGIRIEDTMIVRSDGAEILTKRLIKEIELKQH